MFIQLSQGHQVQFDDADAELVLAYTWWLQPPRGRAKTYYCYTQRDKKNLTMHNLIIGPPPHGLMIDHINRDGLDNRRSNLRFATRSQNNANRSAPLSASKFRGVRKHGRKYRAEISVSSRKSYSKLYATAEEAARAFDEMATAAYGEFAVLNFPLQERG